MIKKDQDKRMEYFNLFPKGIAGRKTANPIRVIAVKTKKKGK